MSVLARIFLSLYFCALTLHVHAAPGQFDFSAEERAWLAAGHTVRARVSNYPPYMIAGPTPSGIAVDYLQAVADRIGFKVEFVTDRHGWPEAMRDVMGPREHYDLLLTMNRSPEREQKFALSVDYLTAPWVIFTRDNSPYVGGLEALAGKVLAAEKAFLITERIKAEYPAIRLLEVAQSVDALRAVATGQADAYVGNLANATFLIRQERFENLTVAAPSPFGNHTQAMAVRKDWAVLAGLIDKGFASLTAQERHATMQKWGAIEVRPRINYVLVWQVAAASLAILALFVYWNRRLAREIARREAVEADLRLAKASAESASRAKSTFLANMSHELRTPMNAIMGMTNLALRHADDPHLKDQLGKIEQASQHLLHVINDILDISKIEAERLTLEHANFKLGSVLENLASLIAHKVSEKGLKLHVDLPAGMPAMALAGDPLRLGQILLNLVGNAVKFTDSGTITLRCECVDENPADVLLRWAVTDTGIGIAPEDQRRLFAAFEQADGSVTRKYGGTGLGLAISKRLVEMMGGEIGVNSAVGQGSTFWFTVRLKKADAAVDAVAPAPTVTLRSAEEQLIEEYRGKRVLLVEDEPISQEVSRGLLEDVGLQIDVANDGAEALALARAHPYALILMDMQMPNLNGIDATREIRAQSLNTATPILAMTANAFEEDRQACLAAGMNDHIAKPIEPAHLYETLLRWMSTKSA